jgi:RNA polymerase sigma-70 factor (ECF subfamily)
VEYREVIQLRYHEDLSVEEIAEVLALPEGTVKTYLYRARKELAEEMVSRGWK